MKKLIILALASTTAFNLAACNSDPIEIDDSVLTSGDSNANKLGGYWWTYVDRTGKSAVVPDTGKVEPTNAASTALKDGIKEGNGIADDGTGNKALHVTGYVAPAPVYSTTLGSAVQEKTGEDWRDPYVDANYSSLCEGGTCKEVAYPSAGLGMGFLKGNAPLGTKAAGMVGFAFKFKLGAGHGTDTSTGQPYLVAMSLPMDLTDVPDPSFGDAFGTEYGSGTPHSGVAAVPGKNQPFCSFPGSLTAAGTPVGGKNKTCFANLGTFIEPAPTTEWKKYCVKFTDFGAPAWASGLGLPEVNIQSVIPERVIKLQFDAFKPKDTATEPAAFDFWVDDVIFLDEAKFATECADATPVAATTPLP